MKTFLKRCCLSLCSVFFVASAWATFPEAIMSFTVAAEDSQEALTDKGLVLNNNATVGTAAGDAYSVVSLIDALGKSRAALKKLAAADDKIATLSLGEERLVRGTTLSFWATNAKGSDGWKDSIGIDYDDNGTTVYQVWEQNSSTNHEEDVVVSIAIYGSANTNLALNAITGANNNNKTLAHWVLSTDADGVTSYYQNGRLRATKGLTDADKMPATRKYKALGFGGSLQNTEHSGIASVTDVRLYGEALTAAQVVELYTEGMTAYDLTGEGAATKLSEIEGLTEGSESDANIRLPADAIFEIDGTKTFAKLNFISSGSVTLKVSDMAVANIGQVDASLVSGTVTLEWSADGSDTAVGAAVTKSEGVDVVKKVGDKAFSTTTGNLFANKQVIVSGGTVTLDADLSTTIATAEKPMTVTGSGVELKLKGLNHNYNRLPNDGTVLAKDGATLAIEGVNLFSSIAVKRPNVKVDGATFRVDTYSGAHMKVKTVTLANNSTVQIAGTVAAYNTEGLVIDGGDGTKLAVTSGTENAIAYAEGAHANKLVINGGVIEVAESAKVMVDVVLGQAIVKRGAGELELPQSRLQSATVEAGSLSITGASGNLPQNFSGTGTVKLAATADVVLAGEWASTLSLEIASAYQIDLGESRPTIAALPEGATLKLSPTAEELIAGKIVLQTSGEVELTTDILTVTNDDGITIGGDGSIELSTGIPTWCDGDWVNGDEPEAGEDAYIDFGTTPNQTCTWEHASALTLGTVVVNGSGTVAFTGAGALTIGALELPDDAMAQVTLSTVANLTVTGEISGEAALTWASGSLIQTNAAILATSYTGALTLEGGYWQWGNNAGITVNASSSVPALGASVTVKSGAQLRIHPWATGYLQDRVVNNKVNFTAPLILEGGTVYCNDGSYGFASVQVNAASKLHQHWGDKAAVIQRLFGAGTLTFEHDKGSDSSDGYLAVWYTYNQQAGVSEANSTAFTGTLAMRQINNNATQVAKLHSDTTTGFNKATLDLGVRTTFILNAHRSAGALVGAGTVKSDTDGTERTLTIGGYTPAEGEAVGNFSGTLTGDIRLVFGADNAVLNLTGSLGTVADGVGTYAKDLAITNGSTLSLGLTNPTTLSGILSGMGAVKVTGGTVTLTAENTYIGGTVISGGTLKLQGTSADKNLLAKGSAVTVGENGTLELNSGVTYAVIDGDGTTKVTGTFDLVYNTDEANTNERASVGTRILWVDTGATLGLRVYGSAHTFTFEDVQLAGDLKTSATPWGTTTGVVTVQISGTLSGDGSIAEYNANRPIAVAFSNGAMLDATAGAPTIPGDITFNDNLTVKVASDATFPLPVLVKNDLAVPTTSYQIQVGEKVYTNGAYDLVQTIGEDNAKVGLSVAFNGAAKGDGTYYADLTDAVNQALSDGTGTVEVLVDASDTMNLGQSGKNLTLVGKGGNYTGNLTIASGVTVTIEADSSYTEANPWKLTGIITNRGTLNTKGYVWLSNGANESSGTLKVETGSLKLNTGDQKLTGTLEVADSAKLVNERGSDSVAYDDTIAINVYGTLDMTNTRWSIGANNVINLYGGATVICDGSNSNGAWDFISDSTQVYVKPVPEDEDASKTVTVSAKIKLRANPTITVEEGMTLDLDSTIINGYTLNIAGAGLTEISGVTPGTTILTVSGVLGGTKTIEALTFLDGGAIDTTAGALTVSGAITYPTGTGMVKFKVADTAAAANIILTKAEGNEATWTLPTKYQVVAGADTDGSDTLTLALDDTTGNLVLAAAPIDLPVLVDGQVYPTIEAAVAAANAAGVPLTVTASHELDTLDLSGGTKVAFENNAELKVKELILGENRSVVVNAEDKSKLIIADNGSLTMTEGRIEKTPIVPTWTMGTNVSVTIYGLNCNYADPTQTPDEVLTTDKAGEQKVTVDADGKVNFYTTLDGKGAWYEWLFDGNKTHTGYATDGGLSQDNGPNYIPVIEGDTTRQAVTLNSGVYRSIPYHSAIDTDHNPDGEWAASFFARVPANEGGVVICFGRTSNNDGAIALIRGDADVEDQVLLVYIPGRNVADGTNYTLLREMDVSHAEDQYHLYTFVKRKDGIEIFLDDHRLALKDGNFPIGTDDPGIQMGSLFGGDSWSPTTRFTNSKTGVTIARAEYNVDKPAAVDMLRIYNCGLTNAEVKRIATQYPYDSPYGSYKRTFGGTANWNETDAEKQWVRVSDETKVAEPPQGDVTLTVDAASAVTVTMNSASTGDLELDKVVFEGNQQIVLVAPEAAETIINHIKVTDLATIKTSVDIDCATMTLAGPVEVSPGATLTLRISDLFVRDWVAAATTSGKSISHVLTGTVTLLADDEGIAAQGQLEVVLPQSIPAGWNVYVNEEVNSDTRLYTLVVEHCPWFVEVNGDTVTWKTGVDAGTAVEIDTLPASLYGQPVTVTAAAAGELVLPAAVSSLTVNGTAQVTLTDTSAIAALTLGDGATVALGNGVVVSAAPTMGDGAKVILGTGEAVPETLPLAWTNIPTSGTLGLNYSDITVSDVLAGEIALAIEGGMATLTAANTYSGGTIIADNARLVIAATADATAVLPNTKTVTINKDGTLELKRGTTWCSLQGAGVTEVSGDFTVGIGTDNESPTHRDVIETAIIVNKDCTLTFANWAQDGYAPALPLLTVDGTLTKSDDAHPIGVSVNALSGEGTINIPVTFADGAVIDATAGTAVTINGEVTYPTAEATNGLTVKVASAPAVASSIGVLKKTRVGMPAKYVIEEKTPAEPVVELVLAVQGDTLVVTRKPAMTSGEGGIFTPPAEDAPAENAGTVDIVVPTTDSTDTTAEAVTVTPAVVEVLVEAAAKQNVATITAVEVKLLGGVTVAESAVVDVAEAGLAAAELFENIVTVTPDDTVAAEGKVTITYAFGIEKMTLVTEDVGDFLLLAVRVTNALNPEDNSADFAKDVTLTVTNDGADIGAEDVNELTHDEAPAALGSLKGKPGVKFLKVKANKTMPKLKVRASK